MPTETHHINVQGSTIHYLRWGTGREWLFCFHGYGEDAGSFAFLEEELGSRFTLVAIDFPFHGTTRWQEGVLLEPAVLIDIINQIKPPQETMQVLGYSMGGRVALQLLQEIPEQITRLLLVAPDGLHKNKWQWIATHTRIGKRLFKWVMKKPSAMLFVLDLAGKMGLYNKRLLKFLHYYLDDAAQRTILYQRWTTMHKFRPVSNLLRKIITENNIRLSLLFGRYDTVIRSHHGIRFSQHTKNLVTVTEIEAGHQLLKEKHLPLLVRLLVE